MTSLECSSRRLLGQKKYDVPIWYRACGRHFIVLSGRTRLSHPKFCGFGKPKACGMVPRSQKHHRKPCRGYCCPGFGFQFPIIIYIYISPRTSFHTQAQKQLLVPPSWTFQSDFIFWVPDPTSSLYSLLASLLEILQDNFDVWMSEASSRTQAWILD